MSTDILDAISKTDQRSWSVGEERDHRDYHHGFSPNEYIKKIQNFQTKCAYKSIISKFKTWVPNFDSDSMPLNLPAMLVLWIERSASW